jgi:hypothetical protein
MPGPRGNRHPIEQAFACQGICTANQERTAGCSRSTVKRRSQTNSRISLPESENLRQQDGSRRHLATGGNGSVLIGGSGASGSLSCPANNIDCAVTLDSNKNGVTLARNYVGGAVTSRPTSGDDDLRQPDRGRLDLWRERAGSHQRRCAEHRRRGQVRPDLRSDHLLSGPKLPTPLVARALYRHVRVVACTSVVDRSQPLIGASDYGQRLSPVMRHTAIGTHPRLPNMALPVRATRW